MAFIGDYRCTDAKGCIDTKRAGMDLRDPYSNAPVVTALILMSAAAAPMSKQELWAQDLRSFRHGATFFVMPKNARGPEGIMRGRPLSNGILYELDVSDPCARTYLTCSIACFEWTLFDACAQGGTF